MAAVQIQHSPKGRSAAGRVARVVGTAVVAAVVSLAVLSAPAMASQIDNEGEVTVDVWFDCGIACGNYFRGIPPGGSASRPSKAGRVEACVPASPRVREVPVIHETRPQVGAHGEVAVSAKHRTDEPEWSTFTWTSKGGNSWTGSVTHKVDRLEDTQACWRGTA